MDGCAAQVLTLLRGVYLHLLFMPALLSAPLCMGLGMGRDAWLLLMRWTLERAGPVRCPVPCSGSVIRMDACLGFVWHGAAVDALGLERRPSTCL